MSSVLAEDLWQWIQQWSASPHRVFDLIKVCRASWWALRERDPSQFWCSLEKEWNASMLLINGKFHLLEGVMSRLSRLSAHDSNLTTGDLDEISYLMRQRGYFDPVDLLIVSLKMKSSSSRRFFCQLCPLVLDQDRLAWLCVHPPLMEVLASHSTLEEFQWVLQIPSSRRSDTSFRELWQKGRLDPLRLARQHGWNEGIRIFELSEALLKGHFGLLEWVLGSCCWKREFEFALLSSQCFVDQAKGPLLKWECIQRIFPFVFEECRTCGSTCHPITHADALKFIPGAFENLFLRWTQKTSTLNSEFKRVQREERLISLYQQIHGNLCVIPILEGHSRNLPSPVNFLTQLHFVFPALYRRIRDQANKKDASVSVRQHFPKEKIESGSQLLREGPWQSLRLNGLHSHFHHHSIPRALICHLIQHWNAQFPREGMTIVIQKKLQEIINTLWGVALQQGWLSESHQLFDLILRPGCRAALFPARHFLTLHPDMLMSAISRFDSKFYSRDLEPLTHFQNVRDYDYSAPLSEHTHLSHASAFWTCRHIVTTRTDSLISFPSDSEIRDRLKSLISECGLSGVEITPKIWVLLHTLIFSSKSGSEEDRSQEFWLSLRDRRLCVPSCWIPSLLDLLPRADCFVLAFKPTLNCLEFFELHDLRALIERYPDLFKKSHWSSKQVKAFTQEKLLTLSHCVIE